MSLSDRDLASTLEVTVGTLPHRLRRGRRGRWAPCRYILCKRAEEVKVPALLLFGKQTSAPLPHLFSAGCRLDVKTEDWDWFALGAVWSALSSPASWQMQIYPILASPRPEYLFRVSSCCLRLLALHATIFISKVHRRRFEIMRLESVSVPL